MAKFIFRDANHERAIEPFQSVCGVHFKGSRPDSIQLSREDIRLLAEDPERAMKWLNIVSGALAIEVVNG